MTTLSSTGLDPIISHGEASLAALVKQANSDDAETRRQAVKSLEWTIRYYHSHCRKQTAQVSYLRDLVRECAENPEAILEDMPK